MIEEKLRGTVVSLLNLVIEDIGLPVSLLIEVLYSFDHHKDLRCFSGGFPQYNLTFSLGHIKDMFLDNTPSDVSDYGVTISGNWEVHLTHLVAHEIAHLIENIGNFDVIYGTEVQKFFRVSQKCSIKRPHHNKLWKKVYQFLLTSRSTIGQSSNYILFFRGLDCVY